MKRSADYDAACLNDRLHIPLHASVFIREFNLAAQGLRAACIAATVVIFAASGAAFAQGWKPVKPVEFVVGSGAGGGNDKTARTLQRIWQGAGVLQNIKIGRAHV